VERNGSDGNSSANCDVAQDVCTEGVDSFKDGVLSATDPTFVFHEKPSLSSSGKKQFSLVKQSSICFLTMRC